MKKNEWNEERIKVLLNQLPTVKDQRSAQQVYKQLLMAKQEKKKNKHWVWPVLASFAVLFLAFLIAPVFFKGNQNASESSESNLQMKEEASTDDSAVTFQKEIEKDAGLEQSSEETNEKSLIVPARDAKRYFTVAFTDAAMASVIPVSIEKSTETENINDIIKKYDKLKLKDLGLFKPPFYDNMKIEEDSGNKEVTVFLSKNDDLSSSAESQWFEKLLKETMKWSPYDRVQIKGNASVAGDLLGGMEEIEKIQEKNAYLKYETDSGERYLMPTEQSFNTVEEAFDSMKIAFGAEQIKPLMPDGLSIESVQSEGHELIVNFSDTKEQIQPADELAMLEGIMLTAKEFGYQQVLFTNLSKTRIGSYDVTKPIDVPAAPNPIKIN
ncbi:MULTISPECIES: hypothetical protein [Bacillus]|uniref:Sigma-X negative effector n=2 Tax=Bacillus TaxID=1386 RepID=A0A0M4FQH4_9BACI|nr:MULTISPECIES: hypothetical protein [Bacillus]ALC81448.1 hypothetical protein AM592_07445 [Bacillus gobiensis]MBP1080487.1 hypothetical protein [Bacillus capparidis]MED1094344.1 hypothetical protein [Bacillus capparidis]